ncbi:MAG: hypothetical protein ACRD4Y_18165 [Candidatus Acidiferrales bacterium]
MDDSNTIPETRPLQPTPESEEAADVTPLGAPIYAAGFEPESQPGEWRDQAIDSPPPADVAPPATSADQPASPETSEGEWRRRTETRRRNLRQNLFLLLGLTLAAFTLTSWILIRVDSPFGIFSSGPQEIVRAQLVALDRGELRPAYDMFSARYRGQVSFEMWHELIVTHMEMFRAEVVRSEVEASAGPGVSLDLFLHGDDNQDYLAHFTMIRSGGRWWIDDVHWIVEPEEREVIRT